MFFDYRELEEETEVEETDGEKTYEHTSKIYGEWRRVQRRIYSPFWRFLHNALANPMLAIYRPWGERLHEWTEKKMYEPRGDLPPIVSDKD